MIEAHNGSPAPDRRSYIGGGDIGAILGVDKYKSALDVWQRKLGLVADPSNIGEPAEWGNRLEPVIAQAYAEREGVAVIKGVWMRGPKPHLGGTPDYLIDGKRRGLEVKAPGYRMAHEWGDAGDNDDIPEGYLLQCHWYMAITGFLRWDVAALIGGQELRIYRIPRDPEICQQLLAHADRFWCHHILGNVPPPADGSESASKALARMFPKHRGPLLSSTPRIDELAAQLRDARARLDQAEDDKRATENAIKEILGDAEGVEGAWGRMTWRANKDSKHVDLDGLRADPAAASILSRHTKDVPGARVLRVKFRDQ